MGRLEIRRLNPEDAVLYKALRLEALQNHPEAFGSDYEAEKDRPVEPVCYAVSERTGNDVRCLS